MTNRPVHARITGPVVMIGFGSIGKGTLPLIERHFAYDKSRFVIIDPHEDGELARQHGVRFIKQAVTSENYREVLVPLLDVYKRQEDRPAILQDRGNVLQVLGRKSTAHVDHRQVDPPLRAVAEHGRSHRQRPIPRLHLALLRADME